MAVLTGIKKDLHAFLVFIFLIGKGVEHFPHIFIGSLCSFENCPSACLLTEFLGAFTLHTLYLLIARLKLLLFKKGYPHPQRQLQNGRFQLLSRHPVD